MATVFDRLKRIIIDQLGVDEVRVVPSASFVDDLEADSLDLIEMIMAIEDEFKIQISDEDAERIATVQDFVDYLKGLGASPGPLLFCPFAGAGILPLLFLFKGCLGQISRPLNRGSGGGRAIHLWGIGRAPPPLLNPRISRFNYWAPLFRPKHLKNPLTKAS